MLLSIKQDHHLWHLLVPRGPSCHLFTFHSTSTSPPVNSLPVTISTYGTTIRIKSFARPHTLSSPAPPIPSTFAQFTKTLHTTKQQILGNIFTLIQPELSTLLSQLLTTSVVIGSNGSVTSAQASYASRLQSSSNMDSFIHLYNYLLTNSSYIAKGYALRSGIHNMSVFLLHIAFAF